MDISKLITVTEAAERAGVDRSTIKRACASGRLRAWRVGVQWLIDPVSVESFTVLPGGRPTGRRDSAPRARRWHRAPTDEVPA